MAHVEVKDLQQFIEGDLLSITAVDLNLDATYSSEVLAKLAISFDVSTWITPATTPALVRSIIAALIVAQVYERTWPEESPNESWYPRRLREWAYGLLQQVLEGTAILVEVDPTTDPQELGQPVFFPTDLQDTDGSGNERKFSMGMRI